LGVGADSAENESETRGPDKEKLTHFFFLFITSIDFVFADHCSMNT
jgi:hypothetical protein